MKYTRSATHGSLFRDSRQIGRNQTRDLLKHLLLIFAPFHLGFAPFHLDWRTTHSRRFLVFISMSHSQYMIIRLGAGQDTAKRCTEFISMIRQSVFLEVTPIVPSIDIHGSWSEDILRSLDI